MTFTIPGAEKLSRWLVKAPAPTIAMIVLTAFAAIGGALWTLAAEISNGKADIATAVERATGAQAATSSIDRRLGRVEAKLDRVMDKLDDIHDDRAHAAAQKEK